MNEGQVTDWIDEVKGLFNIQLQALSDAAKRLIQSKHNLDGEKSKVELELKRAQQDRDETLSIKQKIQGQLDEANKALSRAKANEFTSNEMAMKVKQDEAEIVKLASQLEKQKVDLGNSQRDLSKRETRVEMDEREVRAKRIEVERLIRDNKLQEKMSG